jgi:cobaltochelatase CobN
LFDPWADEEGAPLSADDRQRLQDLGCHNPRHVGDGVAWLERLALQLLAPLLDNSQASSSSGSHTEAVLERLRTGLVPDLLCCGDAERNSFLTALAGGRIAAGPSGAPTRGRPDLLPTGRNFYSVDLRGLPTEAAWDLGRRSAELLLDQHLMDEGEPLRHLALSVWGTSTMRNGGEDIAQALALLGVRPVWDGPSRRLVELELIPLQSLGRPCASPGCSVMPSRNWWPGSTAPRPWWRPVMNPKRIIRWRRPTAWMDNPGASTAPLLGPMAQGCRG